jgi:23S rRNA pseudouridine1911/1915/1917 synthase
MSPAHPQDPSTPHRLTIPASGAGARLDLTVAQLLPQHSRNRLKGWIEAGQVSVNGATVTSPRHKLRGGETVVVVVSADAPNAAFVAQPIALSIVYEDAALLVVDKPAGLVVHPGSGNRDGTLLNALVHHAPALAALARAGIVHRLDKDTSGLLVVAKTAEAQTDLVRQLAARTVKREYLALVHGDLARAVTVDAPIGRHPVQRTSMAVVTSGKAARTHVDVIERFGSVTLLRCRLETGRTHQIRVHLTAIGHPLVGDATYRGRRKLGVPVPAVVQAFPRQALHAQRLGLVHPVTHAAMQWEAAPPADFAALVATLRERGRVERAS